ncbi:solute carrier family 38 (sodium-coupled neutral amino acid transporter), member 7/8 [Fistulifera solaris]|uniref:Solute carrier family 38 (Sodium-coupled neutral amino acid transporter), member 7/8 n=1 Tax=Fistulifera solaris TaxID=1519565 RepID=A0A1Z5K7K7_FISSO|nr:solute carrier family 38 (sodium-coupled neutral amino acid transporter), member 7/8 [Fistulifera solaris]|eukprot:GAX22165.1 solute carrier family 38 (sodium-coupled neutral amino acid transporter), member 7/8 [Fistulifera solaris]
MPTEDPLAQHRRTETNTDIARLMYETEDAADQENDSPHQNDNTLPARRTVVMGAVANLCSATLGAGILSLPYSMQQAGYFGGTLLLLMSAWSTRASIDILTHAADSYQIYTYEGVVEKCLGRATRNVVEWSILVFCIGCAVAYCIAVGDILEISGLLLPLQHGAREASMLLVWMLAMMPLSLLRTMKSLQFSSTVGIASISTLVFAAFVHLLEDRDDPPDAIPTNTTNVTAWNSHFVESSFDSSVPRRFWPEHGVVSILQACPIMLFAFCCQVNVLAIFEELPSRTIQNNNAETDKFDLMSRVTKYGVGVCAVLYTSLSWIVMADTDQVPPNALLLYAPPKGIMQVATAGMAAAVITAFPLNIFPARVSIMSMLQRKKPRRELVPHSTLTQALLENHEVESVTAVTEEEETAFSHVPVSESEPFDWKQHLFWSIFVSALSLGMALLIPDISIVFSLMGGTTSSLLGFCVPGALGIHMKQNTTSIVISWLLLVGGGLLGTLTTAVTIYTTFNK